jgi:excisionase family DNA binding protein
MSSCTTSSMPPASSSGVPSGPARPSSSSKVCPGEAASPMPARSSAPEPTPPESGQSAIAENDTSTPEAAGLPAVLTVNELAVLLRLDRKTVYEEIAAGRIPGIRRFGARRPVYRAHRDTVLTWLAGQQQQTRPSRRTR